MKRMIVYGGDIMIAGQAVPLSSAIEVAGFVFLSGQLALVGGIVEGDVAAQTDVVMDSIETVLTDIGLGLDHIVKTTIWLIDATDFNAFNAVYARRLRAPWPARSCVISMLVISGARVEIEVVASRHQTRVGDA